MASDRQAGSHAPAFAPPLEDLFNGPDLTDTFKLRLPVARKLIPAQRRLQLRSITSMYLRMNQQLAIEEFSRYLGDLPPEELQFLVLELLNRAFDLQNDSAQRLANPAQVQTPEFNYPPKEALYSNVAPDPSARGGSSYHSPDHHTRGRRALHGEGSPSKIQSIDAPPAPPTPHRPPYPASQVRKFARHCSLAPRKRELPSYRRADGSAKKRKLTIPPQDDVQTVSPAMSHLGSQGSTDATWISEFSYASSSSSLCYSKLIDPESTYPQGTISGVDFSFNLPPLHQPVDSYTVVRPGGPPRDVSSHPEQIDLGII